MKKITLLLASTLISLASFAQDLVVVATEDFEGGVLPDGWTVGAAIGDCDFTVTESTTTLDLTGETLPSPALVFDDAACASPIARAQAFSPIYDLSEAIGARATFDINFDRTEDGVQRVVIDVIDAETGLSVEFLEEFSDDTNETVALDFLSLGGFISTAQIRIDFTDGNNGSMGSYIAIDNFVLEMEVEGEVFECPELQANIGDVCGINGTVTDTCECDEEEVFECPELQANIGDDCGVNGTVTDTCECDEPLSLADNAIEGFEMFPNPANNELNISASSNIEGVTVFNMIGQRVIEQSIGSTAQSINVSALQTGVYLIQVTADGQTGTYRFVKK